MELIKVDFKSNQIEVIEETQSIVVKDICEAIGLRFRTQYEKIKSDESFESKLIKVQTRGGLQEVFTIPLKNLNGWLFSINPNKVKPEVKQKLIEYKKECFNVLNNYFNNGIAVNQKALPNQIDIDAVPRSQVDEILEASNKLFAQFEKQKKELEELKNQLNRKERETPFERKIKEMFPNIKDSVHHHVILSYMKSFENKANWKAPKFENAFAVFREDWMILLNVALEYLEEARNPKRVQQLTYKGGNLV